jgi:hypothetical protein
VAVVVARGCFVLIGALVVVGCAASPPQNVHDSCAIFEEKPRWYDSAKAAEKRWGTPISVQLAIIHQESRFEAKARPRRRRFLGFIPGARPSTAYGYAQALSSTWNVYRHDTGNWGANRSDFGDSADFVGWYTAKTARVAGVSKRDAYHLYLAYHEGDGGFRRGTHKRKSWLLATARRVASQEARYRSQLARCEASLPRRGWFSFLR